jgi:hypothetical protein
VTPPSIEPVARVGAAVAGLAWCSTGLAFAACPTPELQLASMGSLLLLLVATGFSVAGAVGGWRARGWRALGPLAACLACPPVTTFGGPWIQDAVFARSLPRYERVVDAIAASTSSSFPDRTLPRADADLVGVDAISAERTEDGVLLVEFDFGGGFPAKHTAYLYSSSGSVPPGSRVAKRLPFSRRLAPRWLLVSN